jgi:hypothetical protein
MPSGTYGCYVCGKPTETMLRIRLEDFEGSGRKVLASRSRSFCFDCANDAYGLALEALGMDRDDDRDGRSPMPPER